ncbi:Trimeric LpxA-like [Parasponia andersonii]|uniref:serine O-acetyltransferase n=1 Tax=Parasponia andersonii TaxID=3476 RepID=A0A2P5B3R7_PARAD|nr:Trimeric LpxA-like [Parasponia andersonii]
MPNCLESSRAQTAATHLSDRPRFDSILSNYFDYYHGVNVVNGDVSEEANYNEIWLKMREEALVDSEKEPLLSSYYFTSILSHNSLESALASQLSIKLSNSSISTNTLYDIFVAAFKEDRDIVDAVNDDLIQLKAVNRRHTSYVDCFLNVKGFLACQAQRVAHKLWLEGRRPLALLIQNRVSEIFAVDIHPGANIGRGILLDHATGVVIGETTVVGDNTTIFHNVTLGGTGKVSGDRHPKIGDGVIIGAGTNVLGNVNVGESSKIGAGSVVLKEVLPRTTAVGNPARLVGEKEKFS